MTARSKSTMEIRAIEYRAPRRHSGFNFRGADEAARQQEAGVSVVALVGAERMPVEGEDELEEARLFYVGATRATQRLVIGASGNGKFGQRFPI